MSVEEFTRWLKLGLGRAVLHLQKHDAAPYREVILDACLHNWAYDGQIEGSRAEYMLDIISLTGERQYYRDSILQALTSGEVDPNSWDRCQLFHFARLFAQTGDEHARQAMIENYEQDGSIRFILAGEFIALGGIRGFEYVARKRGAELRANAEDWEDDWLVGKLQEKVGEKESQEAIKQLSANDPLIKAYMDAVDDLRTRRKNARPERRDPTGMSYAEVRSLILDGKHNSIMLPKWGEIASDGDLRQAAKDLMVVKERIQLREYLKIFKYRAFPLDLGYLIELAHGIDYRISALALGAMSVIASPAVRAFAFQLMEKPRQKWKGWVVNLLVKNYQAGDHAIIEKLAQELTDEKELHVLGLDVLEFYEVHPNPESEIRVLSFLYENGPCAVCRRRFVKRLIALKALPDWMAEECLWDAEEDTRTLAKEYFEQTQVAIKNL